MLFLTMTIRVKTINLAKFRALYKERWQIKSAFKALKISDLILRISI